MAAKRRYDINELQEKILAGDRVALGRAITLIESTLSENHAQAGQLLGKLLPHTGKSIRIGITGIPGAGKSTFIEALGKHLTAAGKKVAVLAVDPSSQLSKGSILADKTRMEELASDPLAFIRPSPAGSSFGGINSKTREAILVCEAAGFEAILIETVGVGQTETLVRDMTDLFLLLTITGAGDELQTIKKGIVELADIIVINKADGDNLHQANNLQKQIESTLHWLNPIPVPVRTCSARERTGIAGVWEELEALYRKRLMDGTIESRRKTQNLDWMHFAIRDELERSFYNHPSIVQKLKGLEEEVIQGRKSPVIAAEEALNLFREVLRS